MFPDRTGGAKRCLVTMALPYANGDLHLGHILEAVQTDMYVRYQKLRGSEVVYVSADDTHGTPIEVSALRRNITPRQLIAEARENHLRDYAGFTIGFDIFSSTDSEENRIYAERIFASLKKNGLVVEREINQFFCEHDKRFLPDRFIVGTCPRCKTADQYGDVCESCGAAYEPTELGDPHCILCGEKPVLRQSRHFFVELGKKEQFLRDYLATPGVLQDDMRNFVTSWINDGLREWCVSRDGPYFGFPIPGAPGKFFYVWLDAPIGYISSTDRWCADHRRRVEEFWSPESGTRIVHFIGKDIVYFHALFWPVMLRSAGFALPSTIFVHGFLNVGGEKMSKSRGTFILAKDFLTKVKHPQAAEYLRFFFAAKLSRTTADIDLAPDEFVKRVNTTLANNFGNLHNRTFVFCERFFEGKIPDAPWDETIAAEVEASAAAIERHYETAEYKQVVERVHGLGNLGNKYFQDNKPWELIKIDPAKAASVMTTCANLVRAMAVFLKPIIPAICASLERQLGRPLAWSDYTFSLRDTKLTSTEKLAAPLTDEDIALLFPKPETIETGAGLIDIDTFRQVELRVGRIAEAEKVEKSKKLLKLQVEIGSERRQVVAGIAEAYAPEALVNKLVVVVANLKPAMLMGMKSEGMLLAAKDASGALALVAPEKPVTPGASVS